MSEAVAVAVAEMKVLEIATVVEKIVVAAAAVVVAVERFCWPLRGVDCCLC